MPSDACAVQTRDEDTDDVHLDTRPERPRTHLPLFDRRPVSITPTGRRRGTTISVKRLAKRDLEAGRLEADAAMQGVPDVRPQDRADCLQGEHAERPCPFVSCKYHLYLDVNDRTGAIKLNFPHLEVWEMEETCALDVAGRGEHSLEDVGAMANLTRERARQIEVRAVEELRVSDDEAVEDLRELVFG